MNDINENNKQKRGVLEIVTNCFVFLLWKNTRRESNNQFLFFSSIMRHGCLTATVNQLCIICSFLVVSSLSFSPVQKKYRIHPTYKPYVHYVGQQQQTTKKNQKDIRIILLNAPVEVSLHSSSHDIPRTNQSITQEYDSYKKKPGKDGTVRNNKESKVNHQKRQTRATEISNSTVTNKRQQIKVRLEELNDIVGKNKVQKTDTTFNQSYYDDLVATLVSYDEWESVLEVQDIMKQQGYRQIHSTYKA